LMLISAYMIFAIALLHNKIHLRNNDDDPSQLVR
jgi:hypothetical protein